MLDKIIEIHKDALFKSMDYFNIDEYGLRSHTRYILLGDVHKIQLLFLDIEQQNHQQQLKCQQYLQML